MGSSERVSKRPLTRRQLVAGGVSVALGSLLAAACGQPAAPAPTATPTQPRAAPTTAPAPTTAAAPTSPPAAAGAAATPTAAPAPATAAPTATAQPAAKPAAQGASGAPVVPLYKVSTGAKPFLDEAGSTFAKQHPEIKVEPIFVNGEEYDTKADLMIAAGTPPS